MDPVRQRHAGAAGTELTEPDALLYTPEERGIFGPYDPGDGTPVYADPIRVRRKLSAYLDGRWEIVFGQMVQKDNPLLADEARDRVLAAAVAALELVSFDRSTGQGLTEDRVVAVLNDFLAFEEQKKTTGGTMPTLQPSTELDYLAEAGFPSEPFMGSG